MQNLNCVHLSTLLYFICTIHTYKLNVFSLLNWSTIPGFDFFFFSPLFITVSKTTLLRSESITHLKPSDWLLKSGRRLPHWHSTRSHTRRWNMAVAKSQTSWSSLPQVFMATALPLMEREDSWLTPTSQVLVWAETHTLTPMSPGQ